MLILGLWIESRLFWSSASKLAPNDLDISSAVIAVPPRALQKEVFKFARPPASMAEVFRHRTYQKETKTGAFCVESVT